MKPIQEYLIYLEASASYWGVSVEDIKNSRNKKDRLTSSARKTFYILCLRSGIDLYQLSIRMGKERTTILSNLRTNNNKLNVSEAVNQILSRIKSEGGYQKNFEELYLKILERKKPSTLSRRSLAKGKNVFAAPYANIIIEVVEHSVWSGFSLKDLLHAIESKLNAT